MRLLFVAFAAISISGCLATRKPAITEQYHLILPVPAGAESILDVKIRPRTPPDKSKGRIGIVMALPHTSLSHPGAEPGEKGIVVDYVLIGSPADKGGLKEDDLIVAVNGEPLKEKKGTGLLNSFKKKIEDSGGGTKITLTVIRDMERMTFAIVSASPLMAEPTLKEHPDLEKVEEKPPSLLEKTFKAADIKDYAEGILDRIRETSYEIGSYTWAFEKGQKNPFRLTEVDYLLHHPLRGGEVARGLSEKTQAMLQDGDLPGLVRTSADEIDIPLKPKKKNGPENGLKEFAPYLEQWEAALTEAKIMAEAAFFELTEEEKGFIYDSAPELLRHDPNPPPPDQEKELTREELKKVDEDLTKFLRLSARVDYQRLMAAFMGLVELVDLKYFNYLNGLDDRIREIVEAFPPSPGRNGVSGEVLIDRETKAGRIIVGGPGRNVYEADAALIIDLGGDDLYANSAGGSGEKDTVSIVIDLSGNDTYRSRGEFAQGSGRMGLGVLIDLKGDDIYEAKGYSQGAGFFGLGILYDEEGNDHYHGETANQGAGLFGIGLLLDGKGDDSYHSKLYSQGFGSVRGMGALIDGEGEDSYMAGREFPDFREYGKAYQSMSQGFGMGLRPYKITAGASGGIGLLSDGEGNDSYHAGYFSQGASYWYALGILADQDGHDDYFARRYSQGAGTHKTIGILLDMGGDDLYSAAYGVSQGCGHDLAVGLLIDEAGNDVYQGGVMVQGAGNAEGLGLLLDKKGRDRYSSTGSGRGWGDGNGKGSLGLLIDLGGDDDRYYPEAGNDSVIVDKKWGVRIDAGPSPGLINHIGANISN